MDDTRKRQAAAAFLRAAERTRDAAERASLRRRAAELLSPRLPSSADDADVTATRPASGSRTRDVTSSK
jgi:hypothetical protein